MASSSSSKKIILKDAEGENHEIDKKAALQSKAIKHIIEAECDDNIVPVPFASDTILKVIEYLEKHGENYDESIDKAFESWSPFEKVDKSLEWKSPYEYDPIDKSLEWKSPYDPVDKAVEELKQFDAEFAKVDTDLVQDIMLAANFLDIKSLIDLMVRTIVDRIIGKTPEEIREILNIENDFTPEEEAALREEQSWAFEGF